MPIFHNRLSKEDLRHRLTAEKIERRTISFYRYVQLDDVQILRDKLYQEWSELDCLGRIYLAREGINAQMSVPSNRWEDFLDNLNSYDYFQNIEIKQAVEEADSFFKLAIKIKSKIVADGIDDPDFDMSRVGKHISPEDFHQSLEDPEVTVVDVRNAYESEVGRFERAICPDVDTFRDELPELLNLLSTKKQHKILLYCTGGIRCEKASAYLRHHGFDKVGQLQGGIIDYARYVKKNKLKSKFMGVNFVFDERRRERVTDEVIAQCHQCGDPSDRHVNCANDACHLLFLQCLDCEKRHQGQFCTESCQKIANLPPEKQRQLRKNKKVSNGAMINHGRLRPRIARDR